eukprot:164145_1
MDIQKNSNNTIFINYVCRNIILATLQTLFVIDLTKHFKKERLRSIQKRTPARIRISGLLHLIFHIIYSMIETVEYCPYVSLFYQITAQSTVYLMACGYYISLAYFLKANLFQSNINPITKRWINLLFIIYSICVLFNHDSAIIYNYFHCISDEHHKQVMKDVSSCAWPIDIAMTFNTRLYYFMKSGTELLDKSINQLSMQIITKQTNLITMMIISQLIFDSVNYSYNILAPQKNFAHIIEIWTHFTSIFIKSICLYLTFRFNTPKYNQYCKKCDSCYNNLCNKMMNTTAENVEPTHVSVDGSVNVSSYTSIRVRYIINEKKTDNNIDAIAPTFCVNNECNDIKYLCKCLRKYQQGLLSSASGNLMVINILNSFDHILLNHDSPNDFY